MSEPSAPPTTPPSGPAVLSPSPQLPSDLGVEALLELPPLDPVPPPGALETDLLHVIADAGGPLLMPFAPPTGAPLSPPESPELAALDRHLEHLVRPRDAAPSEVLLSPEASSLEAAVDPSIRSKPSLEAAPSPQGPLRPDEPSLNAAVDLVGQSKPGPKPASSPQGPLRPDEPSLNAALDLTARAKPAVDAAPSPQGPLRPDEPSLNAALDLAARAKPAVDAAPSPQGPLRPDEPSLEAALEITGARIKAEPPPPDSGPSPLDAPPKKKEPAEPPPPSPLEAYGHPSTQALGGSSSSPSASEGGSAVEAYGQPSAAASDRVPLALSAPIAEAGGSPLESTGQPSEDPAQRLPVVSGASIERPIPLGYFPASQKGDERISFQPEPAADAPSPIEAYGQPVADPSERYRLVQGPAADEAGSPLESLGQPSPKASDRSPVLPLPKLPPDGASPLESVGQPSLKADDRTAVSPLPKLPPDGASPLESVGRPSLKADDRTAVSPLPKLPLDGASPIESVGQPSPKADDRTAVSPLPKLPPDGASPVESVGQPSLKADDRTAVLPLPKQSSDGPSPLESLGQPSRAAADRAPVQPLPQSPSDAPSVVESYGSPSSQAGDRVAVLPEGPSTAPAGSSLETYGSPSQKPVERLSFSDVLLDEPGPSPLESFGSPHPDSSQRRSFSAPEAQPGPSSLESLDRPNPGQRIDLSPESPPPDGGSPVETAGLPSRDAAFRVVLVEGSNAQEGPSLLEAYGTPTGGERLEFRPREDRDLGPSPLESAGSPSREGDDRLPVSGEIPVPASSPVEGYGKPSRLASNRVEVKPDDEPVPNDVLGVYGQPSRDAAERLGAPPEPELLPPSPLESWGNPLLSRNERVDVVPKPDLQAGATLEAIARLSSDSGDRLRPVFEDVDDVSTLEAIGAANFKKGDRLSLRPGPAAGLPSAVETYGSPSGRKDQRLDVVPKPDIDPAGGTLEGAVSAAKSREDRLGRPEPALPEEAATGSFQPSRLREERLGRDSDQPLPESTLEGVQAASIQEAGRLPVQDGRKEPSPVPTGLEAVLPHPFLRGEDRMRMPEPEEDLSWDESLAGKVPVPPSIVEIYADLSPTEHVGPCGDELRRVGERSHRRLEFIYQRYEVLQIRRAVWNCPFCKDLPPVVPHNPRFLAGPTPVGNGLLAQLVVARYGDHANLGDLSNAFAKLGVEVEAERLQAAVSHAREAVAPVLAQLHSEIAAAKRVHIDQRGVPTRRVATPRVVSGELIGIFADDQLAYVVSELGRPTLLDSLQGRKVRENERAWDLFREKITWNREGRWCSVRHRFSVALVTEPQRAAYALFLLHAIANAASPSGDREDLALRHRSFRLWLDEQAQGYNSPSTALERAITYTLSLWDQLRYVDDGGRPVAEPELRRFPKTWSPTWELASEAEREELTTWASLVGSCRLLGVRPWEYLYDLFSALSEGQTLDPTRWTPKAWARVTRP